MCTQSSERQPGLAGTFGDCRDAAVVLESAAVEHHGVDAGGLRALADQLADLLGGVDRRGRAAAQVLLHRRRARDRAAGEIVDRLHVDVLARTEHGQARSLGGARDLLADPAVTPTAVFGFAETHDRTLCYFADLPAFRRMYSFAYRMPLPLYGSGLRILRMSAATWPTSCLSCPRTTMRVGCGTSNVMPSGASNRTGCE